MEYIKVIELLKYNPKYVLLNLKKNIIRNLDTIKEITDELPYNTCIYKIYDEIKDKEFFTKNDIITISQKYNYGKKLKRKRPTLLC
jgi:hypothetical protein